MPTDQEYVDQARLDYETSQAGRVYVFDEYAPFRVGGGAWTLAAVWVPDSRFDTEPIASRKAPPPTAEEIGDATLQRIEEIYRIERAGFTDEYAPAVTDEVTRMRDKIMFERSLHYLDEHRRAEP